MPVYRPTVIVQSERLSTALDVPILLATETFQHTGSFKFRAAYHLAANVPQKKLLTASSGNFGQALAYACRLLHKECYVVMPTTSAAVKIAAVKEYGGHVELVDTRISTRASRVDALSMMHPDAYVASAYDDDWVIAGNASLGRELAALTPAPGTIVVPVGGGGLAAGISTALRATGHPAELVGAEPLIANDAARSLRAGQRLLDTVEAPTLADGARTLGLGVRNWNILRNGLADIVEVPEENIRRALRMLFCLANLKAEPTGALAVAAVLTAPRRFRKGPVLCLVSGGNVDPERYRELLA